MTQNPSVSPKDTARAGRAPLTKVVDPSRDSAGTRDAQTSRLIDRRVATRLQASLVPSITGLRLSPCGGEASLVNISASGALIKCSTRVLPGTALVVVFEGTFSPSSIKSRVARCLVADIDGRGVIWYHVGVVFNNPIRLESAPVAASQAVPATEAPEVPTAVRNRW